VLHDYDAIADAPPSGEEAPLSSPYVPFEKAVDAAIRSQSTTSHKAVGDIAFLAQLELKQRRERLVRVATSNNAVASSTSATAHSAASARP
jgi:hypothetical protein